MFAFLKKKSGYEAAGKTLYQAAVTQARRLVFYETFGVPDTAEGRFDLISLHAYLVMARASACGPAGQGLSQAVFDAMFREMDRALREMGAGDLGVPRRVKRMMQGFNGRAAAYAAALKFASTTAVEEAVRRNLYAMAGREDDVRCMANYVIENALFLRDQPHGAILDGIIVFRDIQNEESRHDSRVAA